MTVTPLGTLPLSAVFPGFGAALAEVNQAFQTLAAVVNAQSRVLLTVQVGLKTQALDGLLAQLALTASIQLPDPTALLLALDRVKNDIAALVPALAQLAQINANVSAAAILRLRIASLTELLNSLLDVHASLSAAIVFPVVQLADPAISALLYDGPIERFGQEVQNALLADPTLGGYQGGGNVAVLHSVVLSLHASNRPSIASLNVAMGLTSR